MSIIKASSLTRRIALAAALLAAGAVLTACSNIDCPLINTVSSRCSFYDASTSSSLTLTDTLTVTAAGTDSVIYNLGTDISYVDLPMRYTGDADTLMFTINSSGKTRTDSLVVGHTNKPHFENLDCTPSMYHEITYVRVLKGSGDDNITRIDSAVVLNSKVSNYAVENIGIYFIVP